MTDVFRTFGSDGAITVAYDREVGYCLARLPLSCATVIAPSESNVRDTSIFSTAFVVACFTILSYAGRNIERKGAFVCIAFVARDIKQFLYLGHVYDGNDERKWAIAWLGYLCLEMIVVSRTFGLDEAITITYDRALGWHLEEIHVTWPYLEKKRTRLRLYTLYLEELCIQSVKTASQSSNDRLGRNLQIANRKGLLVFISNGTNAIRRVKFYSSMHCGYYDPYFLHRYSPSSMLCGESDLTITNVSVYMIVRGPSPIVTSAGISPNDHDSSPEKSTRGALESTRIDPIDSFNFRK
nr:hypothetical protein [Tanacetum cinerariifolium]